MTQQARRTFLKRASVGAAVAGIAAATPALTAEAAAASPLATGPAHDGPLVAYVRDHRTGEIAVMVGDREVIYRDRDLATRLARIGARATSARS